MWLSFVLLLLLVGAAPPGDAAEEGEDEEALRENTISSGGTLGSVALPPVAPATSYSGATAAGAGQLGARVELVDAIRSASELIYRRDYAGAKRSLESLGRTYPTLGIGPLGEAVIYQGLMFENYDFRYEKQYQNAAATTLAQLEKGFAIPGDEPLEHFFQAAILGIDAIHTMRKGQYLQAVNRAIDGMRYLERTRELAPAFVDPLLGEGMYLYWRSVITMQSRMLPDFPDRRAEGVEKMARAESGSTFLGPASTLALTYAYIEERQLEPALQSALKNRAAYPDNVINNLTLGRIYTSLRRYKEAVAAYEDVRRVSPTNQRVWYFLGIVHGRLRDYDAAETAYRTYAAFKDVPKEERGTALYRVGSLRQRQGDLEGARQFYEDAVKLSDNASAKLAISKLDDSKSATSRETP